MSLRSCGRTFLSTSPSPQVVPIFERITKVALKKREEGRGRGEANLLETFTHNK
jgi:hypothetical protein